jgi:hypothetical protein
MKEGGYGEGGETGKRGGSKKEIGRYSEEEGKGLLGLLG